MGVFNETSVPYLYFITGLFLKRQKALTNKIFALNKFTSKVKPAVPQVVLIGHSPQMVI